jgi:predicted dehydrogenase
VTARLLIIACSRAKRPDAGTMPAIDRYDGPAFRQLRRAARAGLLGDVTVLILSARYGLIPDGWMIPDYDQVMTPARAAELASSVSLTLWRWLGQHECVDVFVNLGQGYTPALAGFEDWCTVRGIIVTQAARGIGERLVQTKRWLEARP